MWRERGPGNNVTCWLHSNRIMFAITCNDPHLQYVVYCTSVSQDDKCTNLKGRIALDTCTEVKPVSHLFTSGMVYTVCVVVLAHSLDVT